MNHPKYFAKLTTLSLLILATCTGLKPTHAHDTWVEAGSLAHRQGDWLYVDLRLGNHGNNHRDFKLASQITLAPCTLEVSSPSGQRIDLKPSLTDTGNAEKEGYWTAKYIPQEAGLHEVLHTLDTLHHTTRAVKSGKTYFVSTDSLNKLPASGTQYSTCHQLGLELVLATPPAELAAGHPLRLQVMRSGKPLANASVAFIPRGTTLASERDPDYERTSDANGYVEFVPSEGNLILAVVHHLEQDETGPDYDQTHYSATMVLPVPQRAFGK
ncbi:DUF4198 domain-containing protein [Aureliella helgolandensis]|uniref:Nickel uptake substrate-specific transmembrane region n=1 Tax=Aureliella helgolandensis TaxID=2527968 RepID=A0A518G598_9BACT|nr:DUF4198 domain-containing protein [Aureliella helgolandensis]QDV23730.1 Nickel uptake substrate-specific transmembrane region [Aureliella helgolandensis]